MRARARREGIKMGWRRAASIRTAGVAVAVVVGVSLAGCSHAVSSPGPVARPSTSTSATPNPTPPPVVVPTLLPKGSAKQNLPYFNLIGHRLLDNNPSANASGQTIVDYFVAAGFAKKDMEVTPDKTSIGLAAWNIEFSVKINGACLIGQAGNVGFQSFVAPLLATGHCLIGQTRPIDW